MEDTKSNGDTNSAQKKTQNQADPENTTPQKKDEVKDEKFKPSPIAQSPVHAKPSNNDDQDDCPSPEEEDNMDIPDDENEGFDNQIKNMIEKKNQNLTTLKDHDSTEKDHKKRQESIYSNDSQLEVVKRSDVPNKPPAESTINVSQGMKEQMEHKEEVVFNDKAYLIHPNEHNSIHVDITLTDYALYIGNFDGVPTENGGAAEEPLNNQRDISIWNLIQKGTDLKSIKRLFSVPLGLIESVKEVLFEYNGNVLQVRTKDQRTFSFTMKPYESKQLEFTDKLTHMAFPGEISDDSFMRNYTYLHTGYFEEEEDEDIPSVGIARSTVVEESKGDIEADSISKIKDNTDIKPLMTKQVAEYILSNSELDKNGWEVYNFDDEFERQGVFESELFREVNCYGTENHEKTCIARLIKMINNEKGNTNNDKHTYPERVFVPETMNDEEVARCAIFRSSYRFPALSFYHKQSGTSIWRSSQNMQGISFMGRRDENDEKMLRDIGKTALPQLEGEGDEISPDDKTLVIFDARSSTSANFNRFKGGGFEDTSMYTNCTIEFGNIDNIHKVRDAYKKCFPSWEDQWEIKTKSEILSKIDHEQWYTFLEYILMGANRIVNVMLNERKPVLVHCSDGWDRTALLCSLSQMMIDPFYRTLKGLEVVIEKEWVSFGHQFDRRCGHFQNDSHEADERSPIFLQFLDCTFQLLTQFPSAFQFNTKLLSFLAFHLYSCKFGTFLMDNEWSRTYRGFIPEEESVSIWTYVNDHCYEFLNPFFKQTEHRLEAVVNAKNMKFWEDHFLSWSNLIDSSVADGVASPYDDRDAIMIGCLNQKLSIESQLSTKVDSLVRQMSNDSAAI